MRIARNEKGIALVLVLVLALIGLAMVSALVFMVTQGTTLSGAARFYRTADEASAGAAEMTAEYITGMGAMPVLGYALGCDCGIPADPAIPASYTDNIDNVTGARSCRCNKICNPASQYIAGLAGAELARCTGPVSVDAAVNFDNPNGVPLTLGAYSVTYKIIDTVEGNTDMGGIVAPGDLTGGGVVASSGGVYSPPHFPFLYRVEVIARGTANPREQARTSMLYGF